MTNYAQIPTGATLDVRPFKAHVDEEKLQQFKKLLELSPVGAPLYENTHTGRTYGIQREWLENAKHVWLNDFDWRRYEEKINSFPSYKTSVKDVKGHRIDLHFFALFSERADAVPIVFLHGWPSSNCSFLDMLQILRDRYSPQDLPYHVIVPSLPGYAYSSSLPQDQDYGMEEAASAINNLMVGLGFESGYMTQGGDLGSFISRILALSYESCKGMHVNMMPPVPLNDGAVLDEQEKRARQRMEEFMESRNAFLMEQGTRPSTIGFVLSSNPLALLCWIGEKILEWTDKDPPLQKILGWVTLYWMTDTAARSFWHNRQMASGDASPRMARISVLTNTTSFQVPYVEKPTGYSLFPNDIVPVPKSWAVKTCNLVWYNEHNGGGHFAPVERPRELLDDVEEYIKATWKIAE